MQRGTVVAGRYEIEELAGAGGMSSVFRARDIEQDQAVALKILHIHASHLDARFVREIELLDRLQDETIVRYLDSGVTETLQGVPLRFLVIEWLEGTDLYECLHKGPLEVEESLQVGLRIAKALGCVHAVGAVHRDVKPNNIFLPEGDIAQAKLLDFGIALWDNKSKQLTNTGSRFGTPAYMSPEQVRDARHIDARADVFSLGCVMFECLTGESPFAANDPMAVFGKILFAEPPSLVQVLPGAPEIVDQLLQRMLARDPDDRPRSGHDVAVEIEQTCIALAKAGSGSGIRIPTKQDTITDLEQRLVSVVVAKIETSSHPGRAALTLPAPGLGAWEPAVPASDAAAEMALSLPPPGVHDTELAALNLDVKTQLALPLPPPKTQGVVDDASDGLGAYRGSKSDTIPNEYDDRGASDNRDTEVPGTITLPSPGIVSGNVSDSAPSFGDVANTLERPMSVRLDAVRMHLDALGAQFYVLRSGALIAVLENRGALIHRTAADLAIHAARCALALRDEFPEAPVALATGYAVMYQRGFVGEVIDRAVALLADIGAGEVSSVPIDKVTAGLVRARFAVENITDDMFLLHGEHQGVGKRPFLGKSSPFVGRSSDLATLVATLEECVEEEVARAALVTGPPGFGKSRLCSEFLERIRARTADDLVVWTAQGDPMRAGSPLHLLSSALRRAAGIVESEPIEARWNKLRARVARHLPAADGSRVARFLGELLKMAPEDEDDVQLRAARHDPKLMGDQVRRACADLLEAETSAHPLLFVIEDLHWGDRATVEVLDLAMRNLAERPFLVLALSRPEVHEQFPQLWSAHNVTEIRLSRLSKRAAEKLVCAALGTDIDSERVSVLVERADGNPFYLGELVRRAAAGEWSMPETVMAMVHGRLGALDGPARRVLRAASVFGGSFWRGGVAELTGDVGDVARWLDELIELELIAPAPASRFAGETEYGFRHALLREGAYSMLTEDDRQLGHRLAGQWLEQVGEDDALVLAEHFDRGQVLARALPYYLRAAEDALGRSDFDAAVTMAERGIACGAEGATLGALKRVQMEERLWRGNPAEVVELGVAAMALVPRDSRDWYEIAGEVAINWGKLDQIEQVESIAAELYAEANEDSQPGRFIAIAKASQALFAYGRRRRAESLRAMLEAATGELEYIEPLVAANVKLCQAFYADLILGDPAAVLQAVEQCAAYFEEIGDVRRSCFHRTNVGYAKIELGLYKEAEQDLRAVLRIAERMVLDLTTNTARKNLALACAYQGELEEAQALGRQASDWFESQGDAREQVLSRLYLAKISILSGDVERAARETRMSIAQLPESAPLRPLALATLARVHLLRHQAPAALQVAREAIERLEFLGGAGNGESWVRLVYAETLRANGDMENAKLAIAQAREHLSARADKISRVDWRCSFWENVPEHVRTVELAKIWLA